MNAANDWRKWTVAWTDINSLYPFVMANRDYPGPLEDYGRKLAPHGIAKVTVWQPETELAILPFRGDDGRILYPWGRFTGTWTLPELRAAEANGATLEKVWQCYGTETAMQPYATFVNYLYRTRLDSKSEAEKLFFKLLMNNLYGRLGTTGVIGRSVWQTEKNKFDGVPYGEKVLVKYQMPLSEETNWSHAAYVTAYGRLELLKYLRLIGPRMLIYCDTDSAIFDCPGRKLPFDTGNALGQMKIVQCCKACEQCYADNPPCCNRRGRGPVDFWRGCVTYAPKLYNAGSVYKAKGVPKRLARQYIESGHAEFDLPYKFREAVAFYDRDNAKKLSVWRQVQKFNRVNYDRKKQVNGRFFPCKVLAP